MRYLPHMASDQNFLRDLMESRGIRQADLLRELNRRGADTTKQTVYKLYHGRISIDAEWAQRFEAIFEVPWTSFIKPPDNNEGATDAAKLPETVDFGGVDYGAVGVYDAKVSAGPGALNVDYPEPESYRMFPLEWLKAITSADHSMLAILTVAGDSMQPTLENGDQILIDRSVRHLGRDGLYVLSADHEAQVKRLSRDPRDRSVTIRSDNPKAESWKGVDEERVHVLGRVLWLGRKVEG